MSLSPALVRLAGASCSAAVFLLLGCGDSDRPGPTPSGTGGDGGSGDPGGGSAGDAASGGGGAAGQGASGGTGANAGAGGGAGKGGAGGSGAAGSAGFGGTGVAGAAGMPAGLPPNAIAATELGTCALDTEGTIVCWGLAPNAWAIPDGTFVALRGGDNLICGIRSDRSVACFGQPLGMPGLDHAPAGMVKTLAIGLGTICGTDANDLAFCNALNPLLAVSPPTDEPLLALSAGAQFACGILAADESVECWAAETFGTCSYSPETGQLVAPEGAFRAVSTGKHSTCGIRTDGSIACWGMGDPEDDPDGPGCFDSESYGQSNPPSGSFRAVAAGRYHTCAIRDDGTLACWGAGTTDDCVSGSVSCRQSRPPSGSFEQVVVGNTHSCAMTSARTVECWGNDGGDDGRTEPPPTFL